MQTQHVQEALEHVHTQEDGEGDTEPDREPEVDADDIQREGRRHASENRHAEEDSGQLLVGEREGPQPEVRRGVGDRAQHVLDRLDDLVDAHLAEVELLLLGLVTDQAACFLVHHGRVVSAVAMSAAAATATAAPAPRPPPRAPRLRSARATRSRKCKCASSSMRWPRRWSVIHSCSSRAAMAADSRPSNAAVSARNSVTNFCCRPTRSSAMLRWASSICTFSACLLSMRNASSRNFT
mmetsp:Transcript_79797/g.258544  ORF Transcript_79797/g.258544 Transcript_79797/m.258544 type:complete len:238 (-) Transcript_79797:1191-1904(-)